MKTKTFLFTFLLLMHGGMAFAQTEATDSIEGAYYDLDDIVISVERPVVQSDGEKLTYNLDDDASAKGNSLLDALRKVPMVSVDGENNIRINGQSNFKIFVNGKEDQAMTANYKNILRAMPAEAVSAIEVITEPGARYDAEGTAGILNLVTLRKERSDGYSGSLSATLSKASSGASAFGRMKKAGLSVNANIDFANSALFRQKNDNNTFMENLDSHNARFLKSDMHQEMRFNYTGGGINISYDLSDKDLLTANANIFGVGGQLDNCSIMTSTFNADMQQTSLLLRSGNASLTNTGVTAGTSWQHSFNDNGHLAVLSYQYNHSYQRLWIDMSLMRQDGLSRQPPFERQDSKESGNEHTLQIDYANPLSANHTLEAGTKAVIRRNIAESQTLAGDNHEDASEVYARCSDIVQKQDIYAAYAAYKGIFGKFSANAGVRYEHASMGIEFRRGEQPDFTNHMNDIVPNAALTYSFSMASNIRLSYQMRISRPSVSQVNPYKRSIFPQIVDTGNPDLSSEKADKVTLTFSRYGTTAGGSAGIEYTAVNNAISQYSYTIDNVTYQSYANIGHNRQLSVFGLFNWSIANRMQLSVNARLTRQMYSNDANGVSASGWNLNYGANCNYSLPAGCRINAYVGQSTRSYTLQGHSDGWYYYGIGISKGFLKDEALTLTLNANNFLQSRMTYKNVSMTESVFTRSTFSNNNWNVGLSVAWKFGSLKSDVKKTSVTIVNDDRSSVGGDKKGGL